MATKTPKYEFQKKEDNDFYNIEDFNANWDKVENALTEFDDSGTVEGITSFTDMLTKLVTGNKFAVTLRNLKAGLQFVLHAGSIVNNCVTDNAKLPLSAAQGKALQDAITKLNGEPRIFIDNAKVVSDSPTAFNKGITITATGRSSSFPNGFGIVLTVFIGNGRGAQINTGPSSKPKIRVINNGIWTDWSSFA